MKMNWRAVSRIFLIGSLLFFGAAGGILLRGCVDRQGKSVTVRAGPPPDMMLWRDGLGRWQWTYTNQTWLAMSDNSSFNSREDALRSAWRAWDDQTNYWTPEAK